MLYALVVIYNKSCEESITLRKILPVKDQIELIVFDNSTQNYDNMTWCKKLGITYYTLFDNVGLSKAYNYVIKRLEHRSSDYIIILDDDTEITNEYFDEIKELISTAEYQVVLPIVKSGSYIMSPCVMKFGCKPSKVMNIQKINKKVISAINSGMVIRLDIFDEIEYDEELFLDCVDHDFMNQVRQQGLKICIMESEIQQNYSLNSKGTIESAAFRFAIQKKDLKAYYQKSNHMLIYHLYILWIAIKLAIKYKSFNFFIL